jgi:hypothetical protein
MHMAKTSATTRRRVYASGVIAIVGLAALVRMIPLWSALPYTSYIDENHVLHPAAHMVANDTWDPGVAPHTYAYPSFLAESTAATAQVVGWVTGTHIRAGARQTERLDSYDVVEPSELIWSGRFVVALLSVGTVIMTMLLARRLLGRRAALMAGLIASVLPALVSRAPIVIVDTPATFFVMATVVLAAHVDAAERGRRWLYAVLSGVAVGLAVASKYPSGAVILVTLAALALDRERSALDRVGRAGVAVVTAALTTLAAMPAFLVHRTEVIRDIQAEADLYRTKAAGVGYLGQLVTPGEAGWWLTLLAIPGVVLLVWWTRSRRLTIAWLAFAVPFSAYLASQTYQPLRNVLPMLPFAAVAASATFVGIGRLARQRGRVSRPVVASGTMTAAVALALILFFMGTLPFVRRQSSIVDTRTEAAAYVRTLAALENHILVARELEFAPTDLQGLARHVTVAPATGPRAARVDPRRFDFVVTGRFLKPSSIWSPALRARPIVSFGSRPQTAQTVKGWSGPDQIIVVYRVANES